MKASMGLPQGLPALDPLSSCRVERRVVGAPGSIRRRSLWFPAKSLTHGVIPMYPRLFVASLVLVFSLPVSAINWVFLQFSPASSLTSQDWDILRQAIQNAMTRRADGDIEGWSNPASGAYGTVQPLDTTEREGTTCRRAVIYNNAGGSGGTSRFTFCKQSDGNWRVAQ